MLRPSRQDVRTAVLQAHGANATETDEILAYNDNVFDVSASASRSRFPMDDEPFAPVWDSYVAEAQREGTDVCLKRRFVHFSFPIEHGISESEAYRAATRKGAGVDGGGGVQFNRPDCMQIRVHPTSAGRIPLLIAGDRRDFNACVQALTKRNEPVAIPDSMGACMVAGFNNWDRIARLREQWAAAASDPADEAAWALEFQRIIPQKHLYQDRFIILSDGPYSGVPAEAMGKSEAEWRAQSLVIRREHECAHYFTRRVFGSMRNHVVDELIADYMGIVAVEKRFRADWFLRFMGIESPGRTRADGRIHIYRGGLSDGAFEVLQRLLRTAAQTLEAFKAKQSAELSTGCSGALPMLILTEFTLEELASAEAFELLSLSLRRHLSDNNRAVEARAQAT